MTRTLHTPHRHSHNPVCVHPTSKWTAKAFGQLANEDATCHHVLYDAHVRGLRAMNHVQRLFTRTCLRNHTNSKGTLSTPNMAINSQHAIVQILNVTKTLLRTRSTRQQGQQHSSDIWKHLTKKPACRRMSQHFTKWHRHGQHLCKHSRNSKSGVTSRRAEWTNATTDHLDVNGTHMVVWAE